MSIAVGKCPVCGWPLENHAIRTIRITKKFVYVELDYHMNREPCEFAGLIVS